MGLQVIKQPDGLYAGFSSVSDGFEFLGFTHAQVIDWFVSEAANRAREEARRLLKTINTTGRAYHQFTKTWEEAVKKHRATHGEDEFEADLKALEAPVMCSRCGLTVPRAALRDGLVPTHGSPGAAAGTDGLPRLAPETEGIT